jgi:hypothetical protein
MKSEQAVLPNPCLEEEEEEEEEEKCKVVPVLFYTEHHVLGECKYSSTPS